MDYVVRYQLEHTTSYLRRVGCGYVLRTSPADGTAFTTAEDARAFAWTQFNDRAGSRCVICRLTPGGGADAV